MKAYLDTSSLLKLYHSEEGSQLLQKELSSKVDSIYLSEIARIEFLSAIWKKVRQKQIKERTGNSVIDCFEADFNKFNWINLSHDIIENASVLIKKYGLDGLRSLDSLQLSCAVRLRKEDALFFTSDKLLQKLFTKENLNVVVYD